MGDLLTRGALQALRRLSNHWSQLVCEISEIHTAVVRVGLAAGHSGIEGNTTADAAASARHSLHNTTHLPFSGGDICALIYRTGWSEQMLKWQPPRSGYLPLHGTDPLCKFRIPPDLTKASEGVLHRLRLHVVYSRREREREKQLYFSPPESQKGKEWDFPALLFSCRPGVLDPWWLLQLLGSVVFVVVLRS